MKVGKAINMLENVNNKLMLKQLLRKDDNTNLVHQKDVFEFTYKQC